MAKQISLDIPQPMRRKPVRRRFVASAVDQAAAMLGVIEPGDEITGITNGQFSLVDIIEHILNQTGPASVIVSTWTMGIYDQQRAAAFCANGQIRDIRWLVDPSMFGRRPELAATLIRAFGAEPFRAVNTHAKFAVIRGASLQVCIRSSMNLNPNKRLENFDISADPAMCEWFDGIAAAAFDAVPQGNQSQAYDVFSDILSKHETSAPSTAAAPAFGARRNPWAPD